MSGNWPELVFAAAFLLLALSFWLAVHRYWRAAGGALMAFADSLPMVRFAMSDAFRLSAALIFAAGALAGVAVALSDRR